MSLNANALTTVDSLRSFIADHRTLAASDRLGENEMERLINRGSAFIEGHCGRRLIATAADHTWDLAGDGRDKIVLPTWPIISITSVVLNVSELTVPESTSVQTPGWYFTDESAKLGWILLYGYATDRDPRGMTVIGRAGYDATVALGAPNYPSGYSPTELSLEHQRALLDLKLACETLCGNWFENRLGRSSQTIEGNTITFEGGTMPSRVEDILTPYKNVVVY